MMSGLRTPSSVGMTDLKQIKTLILRTRLLFITIDLVVKVTVPTLGLLLVLMPYWNYCSTKEILIYGVPNAIHFVIIGYSVESIYINSYTFI